MNMLETLRARPVLSIAAAAAAFAVLGAGAARALPPTYEATVSYLVDHRVLEKTGDAYAYDGYYALRAQEVFADTVTAWFRTPAVLDRIREVSSLLAEERHGGLPKELRFRAKKYSGSTVVVTTLDTDGGRADLLARAAAGVISQQASEVNRGQDGEPLFTVEPLGAPLIEEKRLPPLQAAVAAGILGAALAAAAVFLLTPPKR